MDKTTVEYSASIPGGVDWKVKREFDSNTYPDTRAGWKAREDACANMYQDLIHLLERRKEEVIHGVRCEYSTIVRTLLAAILKFQDEVYPEIQ